MYAQVVTASCMSWQVSKRFAAARTGKNRTASTISSNGRRSSGRSGCRSVGLNFFLFVVMMLEVVLFLFASSFAFTGTNANGSVSFWLVIGRLVEGYYVY